MIETPKCIICGMEMTEGAAIGQICYFCIERAAKKAYEEESKK